MSRLARLTGKEIIRALGKAGFETARVKGGHYFLQNPDGRVTVVHRPWVVREDSP